MQDWFTEYLKLEYKKYISLIARSLNLKDLALGSSHGNYGYIPNSNGFNLANTSQDLYTSYNLYLYVKNLPLLKNIFLFYSVFSPGYNLILSGESHFAPIYKLLYNIDYNKIPPPPAEKITYLNKIYSYTLNELATYKQSLTIQNYNEFLSYTGESLWTFFMTNIDAKTRASQHIKQLSYGNLQNQFLIAMQELTMVNNHNLYVIIPPARGDYKSYIPNLDSIFNDLINISKSYPLKIINFFYDNDFTDKHFGDTDHLNQNGARLLSSKIYAII